MSTLTVAPPQPSRSRTAEPSRPPEHGPRGPRLLLPPVSEPESATDALAEVMLARPDLRSVLSPVTDEAWPVPTAHPTAGSGRPLPDPDQLCGAVVLAAVEVLAGIRPITQLTRWVTPRVLDALTAQLARTRADDEPQESGGRTAAPNSPTTGTGARTSTEPAAAPGTRSSRRSGPAGVPASASTRADRRPRVAPTPRATVRRVLLTRIDDRTAEACVVLHDGTRVRAAAARLKVHRGHWRVTVLQIG